MLSRKSSAGEGWVLACGRPIMGVNRLLRPHNPHPNHLPQTPTLCYISNPRRNVNVLLAAANGERGPMFWVYRFLRFPGSTDFCVFAPGYSFRPRLWEFGPT